MNDKGIDMEVDIEDTREEVRIVPSIHNLSDISVPSTIESNSFTHIEYGGNVWIGSMNGRKTIENIADTRPILPNRKSKSICPYIEIYREREMR